MTEKIIAADPQIRRILHGWGYEMQCLVGRGAFSQVYRVREYASGRVYACKVSTERKMLRREARLLKQLSHPLFPAFHETGQEGELVFLFMEYVPGSDLGALLERRGAFSQRRGMEICMELAEGLRYLHERQEPVIFRDLKPENIMIREDGRVKLLDLGSAGTPETEECVRTGTPGYAAPEQLSGAGPTGPHSDVYALGRVMYYLLTGKKPVFWACGVDRASFGKRKLYRGVEMLMADCMRRNPEERLPDMRQFLRRLLPYACGRRGRILQLECRAFRNRSRTGEYLFQQDVLLM